MGSRYIAGAACAAFILLGIGIFLVLFAYLGNYSTRDGHDKTCWERGCDANGRNCESGSVGRYCSPEFAAMVAVGIVCPVLGICLVFGACWWERGKGRQPGQGDEYGVKSNDVAPQPQPSGPSWTSSLGGTHRHLDPIYNSQGQQIGWKAKPRLPPLRTAPRAADPAYLAGLRGSTISIKWQDDGSYERWRGESGREEELKPLPAPPRIPEIAPGGNFTPPPAPKLAPPPLPKPRAAARHIQELSEPLLLPPPPEKEPFSEGPPAPYVPEPPRVPSPPDSPGRDGRRNIFAMLDAYLKKNRTRATELFRQMDKDRDKKLETEELKRFVKREMPDVTDRELRHFVLLVDLDGDGKISSTEFEKAMKRSLLSHRAVRAADPGARRAGADTIAASEVLTRLDEYIVANRTKAGELFKSFDVDHSGKLDAKEIKKLVKLVLPGINHDELSYVLAHLERLDPE
mmetsp:Transcript_1820/g.6524  ORF Transcript_1820/g.6524 Transcript_1820/m.6524 type:complete len:458 (+) Transcript_1820:144-1517(+)